MEDIPISSLLDAYTGNQGNVTAESIIKSVLEFTGDRKCLLSEIRSYKQALRERNIPGNTCDSVIDGTYIEDIPRIIADDRLYRLVCDLESILDPDSTDDVDLRSVTQLYLELVDIVVVDFREACEECRKYPFATNIIRATRLIRLVEMLLKAAADQLSLHSSESPASFRTKGMKAMLRCKEYVERVTVNTGIDAPDLEEAYSEVYARFITLHDGKALRTLQARRNDRYRADLKWLYDLLTKKVMEMNKEMEDLYMTDLTQRRYLAQLIGLSQDFLTKYTADH